MSAKNYYEQRLCLIILA